MDEPVPTEKNEEQGIGPMAATIIIVALVAAAGLYFLFQEQKRFHTPPVEEQFNA